LACHGSCSSACGSRDGIAGRHSPNATPFGWGRNLRTGEAVDIRLKGKRRRADVAVVTDEGGVVEDYAVMARDNRQSAKFNKISVDQASEPKPADLHLAWAAGARVFRFIPS
jgi:hypothetical protein